MARYHQGFPRSGILLGTFAQHPEKAWGEQRLLDAGCGTGSFLYQLAGKFARIERTTRFVGLNAAMRTLSIAIVAVLVLTGRGADEDPSKNLRNEAPVLSRGLVTGLQWLVQGASAGFADDWITERKKKDRSDIAIRVLYFDSHTTTYRLVILKDGSAYSWRYVWEMAYQASQESQFSENELDGLRKAFNEAHLANINSIAVHGKQAVLLSLENEPLSPFVVQVAQLPLNIRDKLGKLFGIETEDAKQLGPDAVMFQKRPFVEPSDTSPDLSQLPLVQGGTALDLFLPLTFLESLLGQRQRQLTLIVRDENG